MSCKKLSNIYNKERNKMAKQNTTLAPTMPLAFVAEIPLLLPAPAGTLPHIIPPNPVVQLGEPPSAGLN